MSSREGNDPYVQIMKNHYVNKAPGKRPRILGLTAAVLNKKVKPHKVGEMIMDLCSRLDSTLVTSTTAIDYGTRANEVIEQYEGRSAVTKFADMTSPPTGFFEKQMNALLTDVGPYGALKSLEHRLRRTRHLLDVGLAETSRRIKLKELLSEMNSVYTSLERHLLEIREKRNPNPYKVLRPSPSTARAESINDELEVSVPPKVELLLRILEDFKKSGRDLCCVIFAQERYTVFALWCLLTTLSRKHATRFGFIRPGFVMGAQNSSFMSETTKIKEFADDRFADEGSMLANFRLVQLNDHHFDDETA